MIKVLAGFCCSAARWGSELIAKIVGHIWPSELDVQHRSFGPPEADHLLVFIHGLTGNAITTWTHEGPKFDFPHELAKDLEDTYVVAFNYVTQLKRGPSIGSIADHLQFEMGEWLKIHPYQSIRFVAHSMGGIIAREYILRRQLQVHPQANVTHVVLLGSPTNGSELAELRVLVPANRHVEEMRHIDAGNSYLESLNKDWNRTFKAEGRQSRHLLLYAAYEELPMPFVGKIVKLSSAIPYADETIGFQKNHITIAKPKNREDVLYRWVKAKLEEPSDPSTAVLVQPLAGSIRDDSSDPLQGVQVSLPQFGVTTHTNEFGEFRFQVKARKQQSVNLLAQRAGYKTYENDYTLGHSIISFTMQRKP